MAASEAALSQSPDGLSFYLGRFVVTSIDRLLKLLCGDSLAKRCSLLKSLELVTLVRHCRHESLRARQGPLSDIDGNEFLLTGFHK